MLFLGNVHKPDIPYNELSDLSLHFLPYLKQENYQVDEDEEYNISTVNKGYIDPKFIHDKTGYWGEEIYRLGVVYIMPNNQLTPVFNIRGANDIFEFGKYPGGTTKINEFNDGQFTHIPVYYTDSNGNVFRNYIQYSEINYRILVENENSHATKGVLNNDLENVKGVVRFRPTKDTNTIYGIDIRIDDEAL
jgi:hypothetical protein